MAEKIKIESLQNLVLEGGGAKGVVYVGAIEGIEAALKKCYPKPRPGAKAILDFGPYDPNTPDDFKPQVTRFAGSSAGAITAFALALGLSAEQIAEASKFNFSNFLKDTDPGKYRMVAANGQPSIGEDKGKLLGRGDGCKPYKFSFGDKQKVQPSAVKAAFQKALVGQIIAMVLAGALSSLSGFIKLFSSLPKLLETLGENIYDALPIPLPDLALFAIKVSLQLLKILKVDKKPNSQGTQCQCDQDPLSVSALWATFGQEITTFLLEWAVSRYSSRKISAKLSEEQVATLLWDRGMFSGFAVREFFYDLMLYASVNDTHFHRSIFKPELRPFLRTIPLNVAGGRQESHIGYSFDIPGEVLAELKKLPNLTFKDFKAKTGIELTLCVSNYTTDEPIFFSDYWTPEFPILEALGASMAIPPAIKPVYNEANVFGPKASEIPDMYVRDKDGKRLSGLPNSNAPTYFDSLQYEIDAVAIKQMLSRKYETPISVNNQIGISGFLPLLRRAIKDFTDKPGHTENEIVDANEGIQIGGAVVHLRTITLEMLHYHYNVGFKGLLLDGGYRCNIPYNIYRADTLDKNGRFSAVDPYLDHTLAIKLDDTYPRDWIDAVYKTLSKSIDKFKSPGYLTSTQETLIARLLKKNIHAVIRRLETRPTGDFMDEEDIRGLNEECFKRIATDIVEIHRKMNANHRTPWNRQKSILFTAVEGYSYGSENGQIRFLSDHAHIVPLYSYGVGTYDFDLSELGGLVSLSQAKARKQVDAYFA